MDLSVIVTLMGGLGLFLLGMHQMGDGMEKAAGARMRNILEAVTSNRVMGTLVGILFCAVIQSSSATTVMVVSFVNAGMMNLYQAAGVIFGANIGTTVTSQLVSFNLSAYAPVILFVGVLMTQFVKNDRIKKIGEVILGFGVLFMGLDIMSGSMSNMKDSPLVAEFLSSLTNPFLGVLLGTVITAIIQSSSVTVSILLLMAQQGLMELPICFYIILGCNIGACMSALLASLNGNKNAKRAALIHLFFNIIGTIIIFLILTFAGDLVLHLLQIISGPEPGRCTGIYRRNHPMISRPVKFPVEPNFRSGTRPFRLSPEIIVKINLPFTHIFPDWDSSHTFIRKISNYLIHPIPPSQHPLLLMDSVTEVQPLINAKKPLLFAIKKAAPIQKLLSPAFLLFKMAAVCDNTQCVFQCGYFLFRKAFQNFFVYFINDFRNRLLQLLPLFCRHNANLSSVLPIDDTVNQTFFLHTIQHTGNRRGFQTENLGNLLRRCKFSLPQTA